MPILTVGLPVYNAMPYLPETVDSLLTQTYHDFNILIVNDGSTDGSAEFLNSLTDSRIKLIHQDNIGLTATLNRMLEESRTPWMVRHDADDVAFPERIRRIVECIEQYPGAGMFYSLADYYPKGNSIGTFRTTVAGPEVLRNLTRAGYLLAICHPTVCLHVAKTQKVGGYRFNLHVEDIDLWSRMALTYDIQLIPDSLVGFRHNSGSISQSNLEKQFLNTMYIQYLLLSKLWGLNPESYDKAVITLEALVDKNQLKFRKYMRKTNINISNGNWFGATVNGVRACAASPSSFIKRMSYEFSDNRVVVNGVDPILFALNSDALWPGIVLG